MNNIRNKLVTRSFIEALVNKYAKPQVKVHDLTLFQKAFIHKDLCGERNGLNDTLDEECVMSSQFVTDLSSNERLEFLGDSVMGFVVAEYLFDHYPNKDEGFLTRLRSKLVRKEKSAYYAEKLGLGEYLLLTTHLERIQSRTNPRLMEDLFESFIGAMYKTVGITATRQFIHGLLTDYVDFNELIFVNDNFKDSLLRYFQAQKWGFPEYTLVKTTKNGFGMAVDLPRSLLLDQQASAAGDAGFVRLGYGEATTKKAAAQLASKEALRFLGVSLNY